MSPRALGLSMALLTLSSASAAESDRLYAQARAAADRLELDQALSLSRRAIEAGDAGPTTAWQIRAFLARVCAQLGHGGCAVDAYREVLALNPTFSVGPNDSPKLVEPFLAARGGGQRARISVVPTSLLGSDGSVRTRLRVDGDPTGLVQAARLYRRMAQGYQAQPFAVTNELTAVWACGDPTCAYYVAVQDGYGNELLHAGTAESPLVPEGAPSRAGAGKRPLLTNPLTYVVGAVVTSAAGALFGAQFLSSQARLQQVLSQRDQYLYSDAASLDARRKVSRALAGASFTAAAALTVGAVVVW